VSGECCSSAQIANLPLTYEWFNITSKPGVKDEELRDVCETYTKKFQEKSGVWKAIKIVELQKGYCGGGGKGPQFCWRELLSIEIVPRFERSYAYVDANGLEVSGSLLCTKPQYRLVLGRVLKWGFKPLKPKKRQCS
jgi:hypothetical protein